MMCTSASVPENKSGNSTTRKNGMVRPNKARSPVAQRPVKRRAVRLCDDDDDELPKTPIHGGYIHKVSVIPSGSDSKKNDVLRGESNANDQLALRTVDNALKEHAQSSQVSNKASSASAQQSMDKRTRESSAEHVSPGPMQLESEKSSFVEAKPVVSPKRSSQSITATGTSGEPEKKHFSKAPGGISQKKVPLGANRAIATASDRSTASLYQPISEKSKATSSGEKRNTTPRSDSQNSDSVFVVGNPDESFTSLGERPSSSQQTPSSRRHSDLFDSFPSLRLKSSSEQKVSPAMTSLRGYYGLRPEDRKSTAEGCEMAVYWKGGSHYLEDGPFAKSSPVSNHH
ncbi:UNVERIFIED_CONTAM: hypothetical protein Slati_1786800 [Sesamum latifolium]|uniref:Uncharacterized protein n=1 Tax=Sesamum latifolium TaxID=2727402 RepID=A0AAW2WYB2_9LAMI